MLKITASMKNADSNKEKKNRSYLMELQPSVSSLEKIMQFAACYKVEKIENEQFVELFLN